MTDADRHVPQARSRSSIRSVRLAELSLSILAVDATVLLAAADHHPDAVHDARREDDHEHVMPAHEQHGRQPAERVEESAEVVARLEDQHQRAEREADGEEVERRAKVAPDEEPAEECEPE